ncbi:S-layer homology domain-containing protein [Selenomonas montiformis]|uniref:S-layer homology domain-containing protein n=1 Tax=Selenomonas montiformis TaxID=2652285 RepID=UPI003F8AECAA
MKRQVIAGITTAVMVGTMSATSFASANPFSDVPRDHWAYEAVSDLVNQGIINGYDDETFKGDRAITRYEMAQMVGKAMANQENASDHDRMMIRRLSTEFARELTSLGARVDNLEKHADMVKWNGEVRYTLNKNYPEGNALNTANEKRNNLLEFRLKPSIEINDKLTVNAQLSTYNDSNKDSESAGRLNQIYAEGKDNSVVVRAGKLPTNDTSKLVLDNDYNSFSGAEITTGNKIKVYGGVGRFSNNHYGFERNHKLNDTANYQYIGTQLTHDKFTIGGAYHHFASEDFKTIGTNSGDVDIWSVNTGYRANENIGVKFSYAQNANISSGNKSYDATLNYKGAEASNVGAWGLYVSYRNLGQNVTLAPTYTGMGAGERGYIIGGNYTLFKNVVASGSYFTGKAIRLNDSDDSAHALFGRVQFYF